ncbi:MAG TPA: glycosyltransferase family 2 protein [Thermoanaerobaculia bacterium]|nr:glycosyltransferase family 2 protein [Thermoanaerobaculia bacterium]
MTEPLVTVVLPVRNEAGFIARSLGAVLEQDYPPARLEVIVADGMSTDATRAIVLRSAAAHPEIPVSIVDNPEGIVPTGMNAGIASARGDVIVRVDGHTIVAPDYVRRCVDALRRTGAQNVGGRMTAMGEGSFARAVAAATSSRFGVGGARFHYSDREEEVDTVYMGAWPRSVLADLGGFDPEMVRDQDDELNYRLRARGGRVVLCPEIRSRYFNRATVRSLARQYFQYGYWKVRVLQKHPRQMRPRQFAPPALAAAVVVSAAAAAVSRPGRIALAGLGAAYAAAALGASAVAARRAGRRAAPYLPIAFGALHFAYGFGFLAGLARFWNRWNRRRKSVAEEVSWSSRSPSIVPTSPIPRSPKSSRRSAPAG